MKIGKHAVSYVEIDAAAVGQRLDNFLVRHLKNVPKSHLYRIIRKGEVRVNGKRCQAAYRLQLGDKLRLPPLSLPSKQTKLTPPKAQVAQLQACILYQDADIVILNKPAGLAVHGGSRTPYGIIDMMRLLMPQETQLELAHRLDRDTSGCLLLAKKRSVLRELHALLRAGKIAKHYTALLRGNLRADERLIDVALQKAVQVSGERMVTANATGKTAQTTLKVLERLPIATLVEVALHTGRTHQIRVHTAHIGHPIGGDEKYGEQSFNRCLRAKHLSRLFLHASRLCFTLPSNKRKIVCHAPLPADLMRVLVALRQ